MTDHRWVVHTLRGSAHDHHHRPFPDGQVPELWDFGLDRPALALGSRQPMSEVNTKLAEAAGLEVTHRRSGGGAVYLAPATALWIDVLIPATDPAFAPDLAATFLMVGQAWQRALAVVGVQATIYQGRPDPADELAKRVCFAGLGWGELTVNGNKVVGLSQRRTRWGAKVQCLADLSGASALVADFIMLRPEEVLAVHSRCGAPVDAVGPVGDELRTAVIHELSRL